MGISGEASGARPCEAAPSADLVAFFGPFGPFLALLAPFGPFWALLGPFGPLMSWWMVDSCIRASAEHKLLEYLLVDGGFVHVESW